MSFRDFTFPAVGAQLGLTIQDAVLFPDVHPVAVRAEFVATVLYGAEVATRASTEKARSEFIISPVLLELLRASGGRFNLFSGCEWEVDRESGLNGVCDFLITHGPSQHYISQPVGAVVEAQNYEYHSGFGQCIAAMRAAVIANERAGTPADVYGVVTYGLGWKFLRIDRTRVMIDSNQYLLTDLPRLMGALEIITRRPAAVAA